MKYFSSTILLMIGLGLTTSALGDKIFAYPAKGQSPEQQSKDEYECYKWAAGQSGFDPANPASHVASAPPVQQVPQTTRREGLRGALRGAAVGAVVGDIADDRTGEGAAIGGILGGVRGRQRQQQTQAQQQQQMQQALQQAAAAPRDAYNRAYRACMGGRGYSLQ